MIACSATLVDLTGCGQHDMLPNIEMRCTFDEIVWLETCLETWCSG